MRTTTVTSNRDLQGKLLLLTTLYLSQGLPFGFFTQAMPVLLRDQGVSLEAIGLTGLLAAPWALKFLWAPLVDRFGSQRFGRRRIWILPLQTAAVLLLVGLAWLEPAQQLSGMLVAVFLCNLLAASQDIATDGLAVDLLAPEERGLGNGIQVAGYRVGMILGGGALLVAFDALGWHLTFLAMAAILAAATVPIARHREVVRSAAPAPPSLAGTAAAFLRRPGAWAWLGAIMLYKLGGALGGGMLRPMLVDVGLELADIGWLLGTAGFVAGLLGALVGGAAVRPLGRTRAIVLFGVAEAVATGLYALPPLGLHGLPWLVGLTVVEHLVGGMATATLFTLMMDSSDARTGATDYTLQASAVVLATGAGVVASGFVAGLVGYVGLFGLAAAIGLLGVVAMARAKAPAENMIPVALSQPAPA